MAKYVALDWDDHEVRLAVAQTQGGRAVVTQAVGLPVDGPGENPVSAAGALGRTIARTLAAHDLGRAHALVAVRRSVVELQHLTLPPAPESEVPEMVRFQAQRQFNSLEDDGGFDYLPLSGDAHTAHHVLAVAIAPDPLRHILEACRTAQLNPCRLTLRSCSVAALVAAPTTGQAEGPETRLVVDVLEAEAELTVLVGSRPVFLRSARLPEFDTTAGEAERHRRLETEIRRTLAAAQQTTAADHVAEVVLLAHGEEHAELVAHLRNGLDMPLRTLDPFAALERDAAVVAAALPHASRFGAVIGLLLEESTDARPAIDLLNPRQARPAGNRRRTVVLAATAAALLVGFVALRIWLTLSGLDAAIARATSQLAQLDRLVEQVREIDRQVEPLQRWSASDIVWLDELQRLSQHFPPPQDAMLTGLQVIPHGDSSALLMQGRARDHHVIDGLEQRLRDENHAVIPEMSQQEDGHSPYTWHFKSSMDVAASDDDTRAGRNGQPDRDSPAPADTTTGRRKNAEHQVERRQDQRQPR